MSLDTRWHPGLSSEFADIYEPENLSINKILLFLSLYIVIGLLFTLHIFMVLLEQYFPWYIKIRRIVSFLENFIYSRILFISFYITAINWYNGTVITRFRFKIRFINKRF